MDQVNKAAQIVFITALYVSFASVLGTVLLIRRIAKETLVYIAPFITAVLGLLLSALPFARCGGRHIFPGAEIACDAAVRESAPLSLTES